MHGKKLIEIKDISFSYGDEKILDNLSIDIFQGDYMGIIGPNGGGKTTLLKIILGLLKPSLGIVKLFGIEIGKFKDWNKIGYVSQKATHIDSSFPSTVNGVVGMGLYGKKKPFHFINKQDKQKIKLALREVEMEDYRDRLIGDLSGGQQQRVFIARALAGEPEVLFLDEPTSGVDVKTQEQLYMLLKKLNKEKHLTTILVSHDLETMEREATELICINRTLMYCGMPKEFRVHENFEHYKGHELHIHHHNHEKYHP